MTALAQAPFLFAKIDKELLRLVATQMGTSLAYNPNAAAKPKGKSKRQGKEEKADKENSNPKRRKRAVATEPGRPGQLHVPEETMTTGLSCRHWHLVGAREPQMVTLAMAAKWVMMRLMRSLWRHRPGQEARKDFLG